MYSLIFSSKYLESQAPYDGSPHKHSLGSQGQSFENISAFPYSSVQEDFHLPFHSLDDFWQGINLGGEERQCDAVCAKKKKKESAQFHLHPTQAQREKRFKVNDGIISSGRKTMQCQELEIHVNSELSSLYVFKVWHPFFIPDI